MLKKKKKEPNFSILFGITDFFYYRIFGKKFNR